jgi:hypothetical protein
MEKQIDTKRRPGEIDPRCVVRFRLLDYIVDGQLANFALGAR